jgi:hypothetical protein
MGENPLADDFAPGRQPRRGAWLLKYSGLGSACRIRDSASQLLLGNRAPYRSDELAYSEAISRADLSWPRLVRRCSRLPWRTAELSDCCDG